MRRLDSYEKSKAATGDLPYGAFQNESSSGSNDGTEIVAEHMQDLYYALYQVLQLSGTTPNGTLENGNNSKQFIGALANICPLIYTQTITYNKNSVVLYILNDEISIYKSLKAANRSALSDSNSWLLICKINSSGVFYNFKAYSPAFTGVPTAPTAARGTSTTQLATTAFVQNAINNLASYIHRFPDYGRGQKISFVTINKVITYNVTANGWLWLMNGCGGGKDSHRFFVNGYPAAHSQGLIPVRSGDVVTTNIATYGDIYFYPCMTVG